MKVGKFIIWLLAILVVMFIFCTAAGIITVDESRAIIDGVIGFFRTVFKGVNAAYNWLKDLFGGLKK